MNTLLFSILHEYSKLDKEESTLFLDRYRECSNRLSPSSLQRDLTEEIALCFTLNPIKEKKWKIYKKLSPSERAGFISRHLLGIARELEVSSVIVNTYTSAKSSWNFSKRYNKIDDKKAATKEAAEELFGESKASKYTDLIQREERHKTRYQNMFNQTWNMCEGILEKSVEKLTEEIRQKRLENLNVHKQE